MHASAPAPASSPVAGGRLRWDGVQWTWSRGSHELPGRPEVIWDLGFAIVTRWHGEGPRWLWLARRRDPAGWHGLRVALMHAAAP